MSLTVPSRPLSHAASAVRRETIALLAPVLITGLVLALLLLISGGRHVSAASFVVFGSSNAATIHAPAHAPIVAGPGYDGQIYWLQAHDPLLLRATTLRELARGWPGYHLQRLAYPALAWVFAGGDARLLPWSLLLINVIALLGLTFGFTLYARRRGWNPLWALAVGLAPGLLMPALRDCSDVLALCSALAGLMLWERGRAWWAALAIAVAVLSREPMMLLVPALWLDAGGQCLRARRAGESVSAVLARCWPTLLLPALAFGGWQIYIHTLHDPVAAISGAATMPFSDFVAVVKVAAHSLGALGLGWVLIYIAITIVGMATSLLVAIRGRSAVAFAAPLLALPLPIIVFGDQWGLTRYAAPMLLTLLLAGLQHRIRLAVWIGAAAAALSIALPLLVA